MRRMAAAMTIVALALVLVGPTLRADQWNDKTILTFSEPVMVPNATLPAGTYVFRLADVNGNRHLVRIFNEKEDELITTIQAIPTRRTTGSDDILLRFTPTTPGAPVALKAWFTADSTYGHEFVYPEDQAKQIAERTKSVVLSVDVPGTDLQKGTLRTVSPSGERTDWKGDAAVLNAWSAWQKDRSPAAATGSPDDRRRSSAPLVQGDRTAPKVTVDDLEDRPQQYLGQRVSVDAEVEEVFGPRLFTIDEPNWGDLDGEILVFMPTTLAAAVREDDRVTVTGTVQRFVVADVEREWGWLGLDPETEIDFSRKPVLLAERLVGGDNNVALMIEVPQAGTARGAAATTDATDTTATRGTETGATAGTAGRVESEKAIVEVSALAGRGDELIGRSVSLQQARIAAVDERGYFVMSGNQHVFVLPAQQFAPRLGAGEAVRIDGTVLRMPDSMDERLKAPGVLNDDIYVYATNVRRR